MRSWWGSCLVGLLMVSGLRGSEQVKIATAEAKAHVGETVTVCGKVVGTRITKYVLTTRGHPIVLNLDQPEPNPVFLILTWPSELTKPDQFEESYQGKQVCVTGKIVKGRGVPQIIKPDSSQIHIQSDETK
jgi:hypothetical protein